MKPALPSELANSYQAALNLVFFRWLLEDPIFKRWLNLVKALLEGQDTEKAYYEFVNGLYPLALDYSGDAWEYYLDRLILLHDNSLTRRLQNPKPLSANLKRALEAENQCLLAIRYFNAERLGCLCQELLNIPLPLACGWGLADQDLPSILSTGNLVDLYRYHGSGPAAVYPVLRWNPDLGLQGVKHPDQVNIEDLIGYDRQKEALINNTRRLLAGLPAHHALLYGPRGSGKSSTIKAIARLFSHQGLRLIELSAQDLGELPAITDYVRDRCQSFIVYIDDLSFAAYETGYKFLKNLLEGGVESRPANLVVYATSNRRHIIQEYYSDRQDGDDLHPGETRQEKLALADRFGLAVYFPGADQALYLRMVLTMARQRGIDLPETELIARALTWEKERSGPSGRAARQFVESL